MKLAHFLYKPVLHNYLPSSMTRTESRRTVKVVMRTRRENRNVQIGSAKRYFSSGWGEKSKKKREQIKHMQIIYITRVARCSSVIECLLMVQWVVGSIPHGGPSCAP